MSEKQWSRLPSTRDEPSGPSLGEKVQPAVTSSLEMSNKTTFKSASAEVNPSGPENISEEVSNAIHPEINPSLTKTNSESMPMGFSNQEAVLVSTDADLIPFATINSNFTPREVPNEAILNKTSILVSFVDSVKIDDISASTPIANNFN